MPFEGLALVRVIDHKYMCTSGGSRIPKGMCVHYGRCTSAESVNIDLKSCMSFDYARTIVTPIGSTKILDH